MTAIIINKRHEFSISGRIYLADFSGSFLVSIEKLGNISIIILSRGQSTNMKFVYVLINI